MDLPDYLYTMPSNTYLRKYVCNSHIDLERAKKIAKWKIIKTLLAESQGYRCAHCQRPTNMISNHRRQATVDHVVPKSRGGTDDWNNLVMSCSRCNYKRQSKYIPEEEFVCV